LTAISPWEIIPVAFCPLTGEPTWSHHVDASETYLAYWKVPVFVKLVPLKRSEEYNDEVEFNLKEPLLVIVLELLENIICLPGLTVKVPEFVKLDSLKVTFASALVVPENVELVELPPEILKSASICKKLPLEASIELQTAETFTVRKTPLFTVTSSEDVGTDCPPQVAVLFQSPVCEAVL
jgi:hypothetical protein